ncbi:hypothetical protein J6590_089724, partial [Homalodisca vitripennis]
TEDGQPFNTSRAGHYINNVWPVFKLWSAKSFLSPTVVELTIVELFMTFIHMGQRLRIAIHSTHHLPDTTST